MIKLLNFSFRGRCDRLQYWRVQVLSLVLLGVIAVASLLAMQAAGSVGGLLFLGVIPLFVLSVAVSVRRLHDRGKSAWWYLVFVVAPLACSSAGQEVSGQSQAILGAPLSLAGAALGLWGLVEIGFRRGERNPNRYGDDPMAAAHSAAVAATFS